MALFNPLSSAFGLDIGDRSFKAVQVLRTGRHGYQLKAWGSVTMPEGIMERGEIVNMPLAVDYVRKLLVGVQGKIKGRAVVACLPEAKSFVKILEVEPGTSPEQLHKAVLKEIEQNIPLPIEEIYYDWQVLSNASETLKPSAKPPVKAADTNADATKEPAPPATEPTPPPEPVPAKKAMTRVLLGTAPKHIVDSYTQLLESAGLAPIAFEIEGISISRAVVSADEKFNDPLGILDIGATRSSLVILDDDAVQMSISIPLSGNELTQVISERLSVSLDDAEVIKIECGLDAHRCEDRMWRILLPIIDDMCSKIRNALRFYKIGFPAGKKIERLYLCGGGAHFRDIDSVLSRKLTIKVQRGNALANISKVPKNFPHDNGLSYATAIGLALRAAEDVRSYGSNF